MYIAVLFGIAFLFCYFLLPVSETFAKKGGYVTGHSPQKTDTRRIPYFGGVVMFLVFVGVSLGGYLAFDLDINVYAFYMFLLAGGIIVLFGLYDDIKELSPPQKLIGQCIGALIFVGFVYRTEIVYVNVFLNMLISLVWIIVLINAFNLLDILDGLAGGISLINTLAFFLFALYTGNHFVLLTASLLSGITLAFLRYNLPPARLFMGDAGSQFLGFCQAVMAIALSFALPGREVGLVIPLVALAIPLFDLLFVVFMRLRQKKSIFLKSNDHFVFRMMQFGISGTTILKIMILLTLSTNICAFIIFRISNTAGIIVFTMVISALFVFGLKLGRLEMNQ